MVGVSPAFNVTHPVGASAEDYAAEVLAKPDKEHPIAKPFYGGIFCAEEFSGDPDEID